MEQNTDQSLLELHVDYDGGNILKDTIRWTKFISIVGFVGVALFALIVLIMAFAGKSIYSLYTQVVPAIEAIWGIIIIVCIVVLAILFYMVFMLYRFSSLTRKGIETQDQGMFNLGLKSLKIYFTIGGILALLGLLFNILSLRTLF